MMSLLFTTLECLPQVGAFLMPYSLNQRLHHSSSTTSLNAETTTPMVVVGDIDAALGASIALCSRDVLLGDSSDNNKQTKRRRKRPIPPPQMISYFRPPSAEEQQQQRKLSSETISSLQNALAFIGPPVDNFEDIHTTTRQFLVRVSDDAYENPILHIDLDLKDGGASSIESLSSHINSYSFLGLNIDTNIVESDGVKRLSREDAIDNGNDLQTLLDGCNSASVTMDITTHLAMLQANSLPKCRGVLGETDVWTVQDIVQDGFLVDSGGAMLLEYRYDYDDPFGGCDPLLRPSKGYIVQPESAMKLNTEKLEHGNEALAAAYSAMRGYDLDPISSICIAYGVKSVFSEMGTIDDSGQYCPPPYTWNTVNKVVDYARSARQDVLVEDGASRRMYREFGYK